MIKSLITRTDPVTLIDDAAIEAGLKRAPQAVISPAVASPAVTGLLRPLLILPANFPADFSATEARLILLHALAHLKRLDLPLNWLVCLLQAVHWFNPLLWFAFTRIRADRELACDAHVLSLDENDCRKDYGATLLRLQCATPTRVLTLGFVGIFERGAEIQARIRSIAAHRPRHFAWQAMGGAILTLLMLFGVTNAQQTVQYPTGNETALENDPALPVNGAAKKAILEKLNSIILPRIDFENTTVVEAIDFLRLRSHELDKTEPDPAKKGVNIVILPPRPAAAEGTRPQPLVIGELKLRNVSLGRILQYICEITQLRYTLDDTAVILAPRSEGGGETGQATDELKHAIEEQAAKVEERRKVLSSIVGTKDLLYRKVNQENRSGLQVYIDDLKQEKLQLESQISSLLKYDSEQFMVYAAGLDLPDNIIRNLYPKYLEATRQLKKLKISGVGDNHSTVLAAVEEISAMKRQMDEGGVNLRATLQAQLDRASERLKKASEGQRGLEAPKDYADAKRDLEINQALLQNMRLRLLSLTPKKEADVDPAETDPPSN